MYKCKETTCDEQLRTRLQRLEEQYDWFGDQFERFGDQIGAQIEALIEQLATMGGVNGHRRQPKLHFCGGGRRVQR